MYLPNSNRAYYTNTSGTESRTMYIHISVQEWQGKSNREVTLGLKAMTS